MKDPVAAEKMRVSSKIGATVMHINQGAAFTTRLQWVSTETGAQLSGDQVKTHQHSMASDALSNKFAGVEAPETLEDLLWECPIAEDEPEDMLAFFGEDGLKSMSGYE